MSKESLFVSPAGVTTVVERRPATIANTIVAPVLGDHPRFPGMGHEALLRAVREPANESGVRAFDTGATRSSDAGRYDPEAFYSPIVIERFSEYMNKHRVQPDGSVRAGDNWQKGIPLATYMKGQWRHMLHLWTRFRGYKVMDPLAAADMEEDLCAILFNAQGMLFEILKDKRK